MGLFLHLLPRRGSEVDGLHFFILSPLTHAISPRAEMYAYAYRLKNVPKSAADVKLTVQQQKECVVRVTPALRTSYFANSNFSARRMRDDLERDCPINHTYLTQWFKQHAKTLIPEYSLPAILQHITRNLELNSQARLNQALTTRYSLRSALTAFDQGTIEQGGMDMATVWELELPKDYNKKKTFLQQFEVGIVLGFIEGATLWGALKKTIHRISCTIGRTSSFLVLMTMMDKVTTLAQPIKTEERLKFEDPLWIKVESATMDQLRIIDKHVTTLTKTSARFLDVGEEEWNPKHVFTSPTKAPKIEQLLAEHLAAQTKLLIKMGTAHDLPKTARATSIQETARRTTERIHQVKLELDSNHGEELPELSPQLVEALREVPITYDPQADYLTHRQALGSLNPNLDQPTSSSEPRNSARSRTQTNQFPKWFNPIFYHGLIAYSPEPRLGAFLSMILGAAALKGNTLAHDNYQDIIKKIDFYQQANPGLITLLYDTAKDQHEYLIEGHLGQPRHHTPPEGSD